MAKEIVNIFGFSIRENSLYEVKEKLDPNAPDGFREHETSKLLINAVDNEEPAAIWNSTIGVWDTGLFLESPFLRGAVPNLEARKKVVESLEEYIVNPIVSLKGDKALDITSNNDSYWNNYRISVRRGKGFNTSEPEELFQLYILVLTKRLTPKDMVSHPEFNQSQYVILDKEQANKVDSDKAVREIRAYELFGALKSSKRDYLINILEFVGLRGVNQKTEDSTLSIAFKNFIEDRLQGVQNANEFIKLAEAKDKNTKDKIHVYGRLKEYVSKGVIERRAKDLYIEDTFIGASLRGAAESIVSDKELTKLFNSIDVE